MLEIACTYHLPSYSLTHSLTHSFKGMHELQPADQFELLKKAIINLVEVIRARSLADNFDLHYIANMHMVHSLTHALYTHTLTLSLQAQIVFAAKRFNASMKVFGKAILSLSAILNRVPYVKTTDMQGNASYLLTHLLTYLLTYSLTYLLTHSLIISDSAE